MLGLHVCIGSTCRAQLALLYHLHVYTSGYIPGLCLCVVVWEHVSEGVSAGTEAGGHSHSGA